MESIFGLELFHLLCDGISYQLHLASVIDLSFAIVGRNFLVKQHRSKFGIHNFLLNETVNSPTNIVDIGAFVV